MLQLLIVIETVDNDSRPVFELVSSERHGNVWHIQLYIIVGAISSVPSEYQIPLGIVDNWYSSKVGAVDDAMWMCQSVSEDVDDQVE